jgi:CRP-like cAMP-binding protein
MQDLQTNAVSMTLIEKVLFLQNVELLSALSPEQLGRIALITREVEAPRGKVLLREKELSECMYLLVHGKVAVECGGERIFLAGEKDVLGAWALLDNEPMVVTATALQGSRLLRIDREDFYDLLADHSEIMQSMFQVLVRRIRKLIEK